MTTDPGLSAVLQGTSAGECAVRMARAGAHIVGTNCLFDPYTILEVMAEMKTALDKCGLAPYLMAQPNGYRIPDGGSQVGNRTNNKASLISID